MWMEIAMLCVAALAYVLFTGRVPGLSPSAKKLSDDNSASEEEHVARELQSRFDAGDHRAVFKLWQRVKSFDKAPVVSLVSVVQSMEALGKSHSEVCGELRSGLECNASLSDGLDELMESLRRNGSEDLCSSLSSMLNAQAGKRRPPASPKTRSIAASKTKLQHDEAAVKGQSADEASPDDIRRHATMIKSCGRERNLQGAVQVFNKLKQSGVHMNAMIYNCLIDACVQCGDLQSATAYFDQMKHLNFVDVVSYNTILKAHLALGRFQEAHALLQEMAASGLPANKVTYNEFLNALVVAKDRRGIWALLDDMEAAGLSPNSATCSILLKSMTAHSHSSDIERTMSFMNKTEEPMDEVLFSSVIEACIRIRRLDLLSIMMKRFAENGGMPTLTAPTYGSMIKAYGQAGNVERVWSLWAEMKNRGVTPTAITFGCTVDALVKNGCVEDAWTLTHELLNDENRRQFVNTVIYSTILKGFAMSKQTQRIFSVHAEMRERDVQCNTITYNTMIDACARCGSMDRVPALLEEMKATHVEPDIITYSTLVKGYCLSGDVDRGFQVLQEMSKDGKYAADEILYNSLLDGCAKQHRVEQAIQLLDEMRTNGVSPSNYTLSILVKLLGRARRLNEAFAIIDDLCTTHGFRANIHVYTCLVQACIQNRKLDRALATHDTMISDAGCQPDQKFYSALARGCLQVGATDKVDAVVRCAHHLPGHNMVASRGAPCGVEPKVLEEIIVKLNSAGHTDKAMAASLLSDLRKHGHSGVQDNVYARVAKDAAFTQRR
jgi:pentatricopeptide repeat protein